MPIFSDIDPDFRVDAKGNLLVLEDVDAVKAQMETMWMTSPGERLMHLEWGGDLEAYLDNDITEDNARFLAMGIKQLAENDPRIAITQLRVVPNAEEEAFDIFLRMDIDRTFLEQEYARRLSVEGVDQ